MVIIAFYANIWYQEHIFTSVMMLKMSFQNTVIYMYTAVNYDLILGLSILNIFVQFDIINHKVIGFMVFLQFEQVKTMSVRWFSIQVCIRVELQIVRMKHIQEHEEDDLNDKSFL